MIATAFASDIDSKFVYKTEIRGAIQPSTASHLERMINDAEASTKVSAILIELNTPFQNGLWRMRGRQLRVNVSSVDS